MATELNPLWNLPRDDPKRIEYGEMCSRPKPVVVRWRHPFDDPKGPPETSIICSDCTWTLSLLEYEQGGNRMRWWRHADPPVAIA